MPNEKDAKEIAGSLSPQAEHMLLEECLNMKAWHELQTKQLVDGEGQLTKLGAEVGLLLEQLELAAVDREAGQQFDQIIKKLIPN